MSRFNSDKEPLFKKTGDVFIDFIIKKLIYNPNIFLTTLVLIICLLSIIFMEYEIVVIITTFFIIILSFLIYFDKILFIERLSRYHRFYDTFNGTIKYKTWYIQQYEYTESLKLDGTNDIKTCYIQQYEYTESLNINKK